MYMRSRRRFLAQGAKALGALTLAKKPARLSSQDDLSVGPGRREEYWAAAIADFKGDPPARERQLQAMAGYRAPDWTTHFKIVEDWLQTLS